MEVLAVSNDRFGNGDPAVIGFLVDEDIDIKPGACPNVFSRTSNGVLPVALVGSEAFDVAQVDLSTLRLRRADGVGGEVIPLNGPPGPRAVFADVAAPFHGTPCDCHQLNGDGILDLSLKFKSKDLVDALGFIGVAGGGAVELELSGALLDGTPFRGTDCLDLVPTVPLVLLRVESNVSGPYVDIAPLDLLEGAGGFESFTRVYPSGTVVTATAPGTWGDWVFVGWGVAMGVESCPLACRPSTIA